MCGIAGVIDKTRAHELNPIISGMTNAIASRGPNGQGIQIVDNIAIGHRRLSIIDIEGGTQPMQDNTSCYSITYNGELYNYKELRNELQQKGIIFKTNSDTEVVLNAYIHWGEICLNKFRGMFAFAILNNNNKTIFLARDPFGIKPLCYYESNSFFSFASEMRAFKCIPNFNNNISIKAMDMYLWLQYIPAPFTIFESVKKIQPGYCMLVSNSGKIIYNKSYVNFEFKPNESKKETDWLEELDVKLKESVKIHLQADVPFGAFLSGGVDSSCIVSLMAQELAIPTKTFTIGFKEEVYSELKYARQVSEKWNTNHYEEIIESDALNILPDLVNHYGEPFGDSSAIPTYYVSKLAASKVPMVLSGDGGDEAFAGYGSHINWMKEITKPNWVEELPLLYQKMYPLLNIIFPTKFPITWKKPSMDIWMKYVQYLGYDWRSRLWKKEFKHLVEPKYSVITNLYNEGSVFGGVNTVQYFDLKSYLPNDILTKVDIASMMHGLEVRTPFVDIEIWKFALTIPPRFNIKKVNNQFWSGKILLKKLLERYFEPGFVNRTKMGFGVPLTLWFGKNGTYRKQLEDILLSKDAKINSYFERQEIKQLLETGNSQHIWLFLFLEFWLMEN
jgi:asparagine synthase (glutamine-hydrolysing)